MMSVMTSRYCVRICFGLLISFIWMNGARAGEGGFYNLDNKYRGFYWFEQSKDNRGRISEESSLDDRQGYQMPSDEEAAEMIKERKRLLDAARNRMIAVGLDKSAPMQAKREAIIAYKKLEMPMWDGAISMTQASDMANFTNPEFSDGIEQPTNVFAVKLKRKAEEKQREVDISEFAQNFDLGFFAGKDKFSRYGL